MKRNKKADNDKQEIPAESSDSPGEPANIFLDKDLLATNPSKHGYVESNDATFVTASELLTKTELPVPYIEISAQYIREKFCPTKLTARYYLSPTATEETAVNELLNLDKILHRVVTQAERAHGMREVTPPAPSVSVPTPAPGPVARPPKKDPPRDASKMPKFPVNATFQEQEEFVTDSLGLNLATVSQMWITEQKAFKLHESVALKRVYDRYCDPDYQIIHKLAAKEDMALVALEKKVIEKRKKLQDLIKPLAALKSVMKDMKPDTEPDIPDTPPPPKTYPYQGTCKRCKKSVWFNLSKKGNDYPCESQNRRDFHNCE